MDPSDLESVIDALLNDPQAQEAIYMLCGMLGSLMVMWMLKRLKKFLANRPSKVTPPDVPDEEVIEVVDTTADELSLMRVRMDESDEREAALARRVQVLEILVTEMSRQLPTYPFPTQQPVQQPYPYNTDVVPLIGDHAVISDGSIPVKDFWSADPAYGLQPGTIYTNTTSKPIGGKSMSRVRDSQ